MSELVLRSQQECARQVGGNPLDYPIQLVRLAWDYNTAWSKNPFIGPARDEAFVAGDKFWSAFRAHLLRA